ncbi:tetratricopeptide repeat protein [Geobacter sp. FeAm09]|uniref:tetratricopeptide repeat protein n=1 Tax=Geobacter sp. FeAm09 TaxID=2597769 RepID=UPI0011ED8489|nr:tetratricopeptide repeat protein [Geobacter sp. FeAm09]QEM68890.1 tetratricopeptide repeat protein [Geobacter sp. FeAm09]
MGSPKDKLIEDAQKYIQRGQLDKAVKAYAQVLSLDPSAINLRQKLAELLVKAGQPDGARTEYETIGKYYASNGFYLKAIAVYKQVQKLFPGDIATTLTLAGLNEKHGLAGNALAEYKLAYDYYEREANAGESLKVLEKMQNVDQQNVAIKLKLAEAYLRADKREESYALFRQLAQLLHERGDSGPLASLNARIQQLFPGKTEFIVEVLAKQLDEGDAAKALSGLQTLLKNDPHDKKIWELVVRAYRRLEQPQRLMVVYQHFLRYFPDEVSAKTGMIACHAGQKDVKGALSLLDRYEREVASSGACDELVAIYRNLAELDPINPRILEGLQRACEAVGMHDEAAQLASKIETLQKLSSKADAAPTPADEPAAEADDFFAGDEQAFAAADLENDVEGMDAGVCMPDGGEPAAEIAFGGSGAACGAEALPDDGEIEIEVDIDDFPFEDATAEGGEAGGPDGWAEPFGDVANLAAPAPRSVKFGSSLDGSDAQSHYDLGVAFKEMGLYDEAINEFRQAAGDPGRKVACNLLQAVCLRERGELGAAREILNALPTPELSLEDVCAVKYELALVLEAQGDTEGAAGLMEEIDAVNADFRDVHARLKNAGGSLDFSDEDLQDFELR